MDQLIIDVREKDEYAAEHVPGSVCVPLSHLDEVGPELLRCLDRRRLLLMCRSGKRAGLAQQQIAGFGLGDRIESEVFAGGLLEWKKQGRPVVGGKGCHLPIMRQVQLVVGPAVLASVLLSFWVDQRIAWVAAFFGAGLTLAGTTGFCPLAELLAAMPWNKAGPAKST